jgi:uncharacterized protein
MTELKPYRPGTFCWFELATTDQEAAKRFYSELFGWTPNDMPMGEGAFYTMLLVGAKAVGALFKKGPEMADAPPHWGSYVAVASADLAAKKAEELGGKVLAPPFEVMDAGRMAVLQDPSGGTFSVWEAKKHVGAGLLGEVGAACWNELATRDTAAAAKFYAGLFGWDPKVHGMGPTEYAEFMDGERAAGGMMQMTAEWGDIPPHWMVYFAVTDPDAVANKAKSLGGDVKVPPTDIPKVGRFAVLSDPQGAVFSVIKLAHA